MKRYAFTMPAVILAILLVSPLTCGPLLALQTGPPAQTPFAQSLTLGEMFTFFFLMLGPLKILGPFNQLAKKGDAAFTRSLAFRGFLFSCLALLFTGILGEKSIQRYHISLAVLAIAAGIILFLVALKAVLAQFDTEKLPKEYEPDLKNAVFPLAFPTIVTPYGISAVIIFLALTPDYSEKSKIFAALLGLMLLNLVAMIFAKPILKYLGLILLLVGTILGVIQVALGLAIMFAGLRALGFGARS